ncbi:MAG: DUF402 domain-containing protein, partial [Halobacteria archaeon]|nr:DUF402 domain-containing protein [Halobacteria archaeon]
DALGTEKEKGDTATTSFVEGRWWYPTVYRSEDGEKKGVYANICTPLEILSDEVRYVDLHVDVVKLPGEEPKRVDEDELEGSVEDGELTESVAEKAREVASEVEGRLSDG